LKNLVVSEPTGPGEPCCNGQTNRPR
jgi:hypothetical protein